MNVTIELNYRKMNINLISLHLFFNNWTDGGFIKSSTLDGRIETFFFHGFFVDLFITRQTLMLLHNFYRRHYLLRALRNLYLQRLRWQDVGFSSITQTYVVCYFLWNAQQTKIPVHESLCNVVWRKVSELNWLPYNMF